MSKIKKGTKKSGIDDIDFQQPEQDERFIDALIGSGVLDPEKISKEKPRKGVTDEFRMAIDCIRGSKSISYESKTDISLKTSVVNRRIEAVINTAQEARGRLLNFYTQPKHNLICMGPTFERDWARVNTLTIKGYNTSENNESILLGATLWMLDAIKRNKKMAELEALLPKDKKLFEAIKHPLLWDCSHDLSVIEALMYIIKNRDSDCKNVNSNVTDRYIINDELMAKGKHQQNVPSRKLFEHILALIPQQDKENAARMFEEKGWEWMSNFYEAKKILWDQQMDVINRAQKAIFYASNSVVDSGLSEGDMSNIPLSSRQQIAIAPENILRVDPIMDNTITQYEHRMDRLEAEYIKLTEKENSLYNYCFVDAYMPYECKKQELGQEIAFILDKITIEDPYALCFGLLYLFETNSDIPWLYGLGIGLMEQVKRRLPWYYIVKNLKSSDTETLRKLLRDEKLKNEKMEELLSAPDKTKAIDFYSLSYGDLDVDKTKRLQHNIAQIVFNETGCCVPRNQHICADSIKRMKAYGVDDALIGRAVDYITVYSNASEQAYQNNENARQANEKVVAQQAHIEDLKKTITALEKELAKQKQENADINQSLHEMTCKARNADEELLELGKKAKQDRMELAELRSIVFAEGEETPEDDSVNIQFPYTIKNRTVVFGGRASAMTAMKTMLKGEIRFMDHRLLPNADMVKNASSVWIQAKCIAHKNCFRIVDLARANGIPIHYFAYTSAAKCAEQVAIVDQKQ